MEAAMHLLSRRNNGRRVLVLERTDKDTSLALGLAESLDATIERFDGTMYLVSLDGGRSVWELDADSIDVIIQQNGWSRRPLRGIAKFDTNAIELPESFPIHSIDHSLSIPISFAA
jgi:hypothetical protein